MGSDNCCDAGNSCDFVFNAYNSILEYVIPGSRTELLCICSMGLYACSNDEVIKVLFAQFYQKLSKLVVIFLA